MIPIATLLLLNNLNLCKLQKKELKLTECSYEYWESLVPLISKVNFLQSWQFGAAKEESSKWCAKRFVIMDSDGGPIAIFQMLICKWPIIGGIARINRGPLFMSEIIDDQNYEILEDSIKLIFDLCIANRLFVLQIAPEFNMLSAEIIAQLKSLGFNRLKNEPWSSALMDLSEPEDFILKKIDGKWRNSMLKGFKQNVNVEILSINNTNIESLITIYESLQIKQNFKGLPSCLIRALAFQSSLNYSFNLFEATTSGPEPFSLGHLVSIRHGDISTYLIGATNNEGRKISVNSFLLWHAILNAKNSGCSWFDLGGLSNSTTSGVAAFKKGLNGIAYQLVGEWRKYFGISILQNFFNRNKRGLAPIINI